MVKRLVCVLMATLGVTAPALAADELQLRNGDRITGDVVALEAGKLTFKTAFGELAVPWTEVATLRLDAPMLVTVTGAEPRMTTLEGIPLADIVAMAVPAPPLVIGGAANAGWVTTGGNTDINNLHLDGEIVARRPRDRFSASAVVNRAEDSQTETAENSTFTFNYDRFLTDRLFANGNAIFTNDRFRSLDLRTALGAGLGYEVWKTPLSSLSVEGGFGYVHEALTDLPDDSYGAAREAVRLNAFVVANRIELFHRHDGYFGVTGDDNLFFRMQNGARFTLGAGLVSTLQLDFDYDRSPAPDRKNTDRSTSLTFGYRF